MRARTRSAVKLGMMTAAFTVAMFAADHARADVSGSGDPNSSVGTASFKYDYAKGLDTTIDSGWLGPSTIQARAVIAIDPVKNGGPLYTIDMPKGAVVNASWAGDGKINFSAANGSQSDGTVTVRHTLTPDLQVKLSVFGFNATFTFDAQTLLTKVVSQAGTFNYDSKATQQFAPWGFNGVNTVLNAPNLDDASLFDPIGFDQFPDIVSNNIDGNFTVKAVTKPTFAYKTTKVTLSGASDPITSTGGQANVPAVDGDSMDLTATVEGEMTVSGEMDIEPYVDITRVLSLDGLDLDIGVPVAKKQYTVPAEKVTFQSANVHIPLPNVKVPSEGVNLGDVKSGGSASKTVTIQNTGEMAASMTIKSSDAQFDVPADTISIAPKSSYDLVVKFAPNAGGPAQADIEVDSNDPDSPTQTFKIGANGADVGAPATTNPADDGTGPEGSNGCGCKTAGHSPGGTLPSWAGFGLAGLAAMVFVRRRRSR